MTRLFFICFVIFLNACTDGRKKNDQQTPANYPRQDKVKTNTLSYTSKRNITSYQNRDFSFKINYPESWNKLEAQKATKPIFNFFSKEAEGMDLPATVHAPADISIITVAPEGYGTELPSGNSATVRNHDTGTLVQFSADKIKSKVFLLENGDVWAYFLVPDNPPETWGEQGFIFAQVAVDQSRMICLDNTTGKEIPVHECDPLTGDSIKRYGQVNPEAETAIREALHSFTYMDESDLQQESLIRVNNPRPNTVISSPLHITGEARGYWFFEANFTIELLDNNNNLIATGIAEAKENWMTEDFVPFKANITFEPPETTGGFLVFKKQNASGLPENHREYKIPVNFE